MVLISESTSEDRARLTLVADILVGGETVALGAIGSHGAQAWTLEISVLWSEGFLKAFSLVIFKLSRRKKAIQIFHLQPYAAFVSDISCWFYRERLSSVKLVQTQ